MLLRQAERDEHVTKEPAWAGTLRRASGMND
jgi:hypothetical protein